MKNNLEKGKENKFYINLIIVTVILLVVFLSSKAWLYDDNPIMQTPFNSPITMDQTKLKLQKWEYNRDNELMEVMIETEHTGSDFVRPTFTFEARERGGTIEYPTKIVYHDDTHFIVQIENVPESYRVVGLFAREHRDHDILEAEIKERLSTTQVSTYQTDVETQIELPPPKEVVLVGDYRRIENREDLKVRAVTDYQIDTIKTEIDYEERQMTLIIKEELPLQERLIESLIADIESIESDMEYQTEEEQQQSKASIESKENSIKKAEYDREELIKQLSKHEEKLEKLSERLQSISNSKENKDSETREEG